MASAAAARDRRARADDVPRLALALPETAEEVGRSGHRAWTVRGRGFVAERSPRGDAVDARTGERLQDVLMFSVPDLEDKDALVRDASNPFFTTPHFDGYPAVLLRRSRIGEVRLSQLADVVEDAWLAKAPRRLVTAYLAPRT